MALELVRSEVKLSFDVPSMILNCFWNYDGKGVYSSVVCDAELLHNNEFWEYIETETARWAAQRNRKSGEIRCLPTFQSTSKPLA